MHQCCSVHVPSGRWYAVNLPFIIHVPGNTYMYIISVSRVTMYNQQKTKIPFTFLKDLKKKYVSTFFATYSFSIKKLFCKTRGPQLHVIKLSLGTFVLPVTCTVLQMMHTYTTCIRATDTCHVCMYVCMCNVYCR